MQPPAGRAASRSVPAPVGAGRGERYKCIVLIPYLLLLLHARKHAHFFTGNFRLSVPRIAATEIDGIRAKLRRHASCSCAIVIAVASQRERVENPNHARSRWPARRNAASALRFSAVRLFFKASRAGSVNGALRKRAQQSHQQPMSMH